MTADRAISVRHARVMRGRRPTIGKRNAVDDQHQRQPGCKATGVSGAVSLTVHEKGPQYHDTGDLSCPGLHPGSVPKRRGAAVGWPRQPAQLQPLVPPQVLHFMQVPLRTSV